MFKLSNKSLLIMAVILSLITTGLVYSFLQKSAGSQSKETVPVVVAKTDIAAKTRLTPEMVQVVRIPAPYLQPGIIQDPQEVIGALARDQIVTGEQITGRRLWQEGKSAGFTGLIPPDKRAVTIGVNEISGVAGFVKAGDYVDVVVTFDQNVAGDNVSHMALQNILVLAANRETENGSGETTAGNGTKEKKDVMKTATVTLAVAAEEAAKLALLEDKGKVRLALRPFVQNVGSNLSIPVTPKDIVGNLVVASPAKPQEQTPPAPPVVSKPAGGIQMIRGTKTERVSFQ